MDGANPRILRHSIRKAYTAALMCRHTLSLQARPRGEGRGSGSMGRCQSHHAARGPRGAIRRQIRRRPWVRAAEARDDEAVARAMVKAMGFTVLEDKRAR